MMRISAILSLLVMLLLPTQLLAIVYEDTLDFDVSYSNGSPEGIVWNNFIDEVDAGVGTFGIVTLSGSNDPAGLTCSNFVAVNQLANALSNFGASASVNCDGNTWRVSQCGQTQEIAVNGGNCICSSGYVVRPTIGNENWGGIDGPTCDAATQTLRLEFVEGFAPEPVPGLSKSGLLLLASLLLLLGLRVRRSNQYS